jgi:hypothetical protein
MTKGDTNTVMGATRTVFSKDGTRIAFVNADLK